MPEKEETSHLVNIPRETRDLHPYLGTGGQSFFAAITKSQGEEHADSGRKTQHGEKPHPIDRVATKRLSALNTHHATCINTKVASTVGVGFYDKDNVVDAGDGKHKLIDPFKPAKVDEALDPLCEVSFSHTLQDMAQDYFEVGEGYFEVVRETETTKVVGLYPLEGELPHLVIEEDDEETGRPRGRHWLVDAGESGDQEQRFACFGDHAGFKNRHEGEGYVEDNDTYSEIISVPMPTNKSRFYGYPDWLASVSGIEMGSMLDQYSFDFFLNRGVPEFILWLFGSGISKEDWEKVEGALKAGVGVGNLFKSLALNIKQNPETVKAELMKLGVEENTDTRFATTHESLALRIVSAHRVPPLLAGILIPGKLGAVNELPNALQAFQLLVCQQHQRTIRQVLASTLGNPQMNGGLALAPEDFNFLTITDQFDLARMDTVARMRTPEAQAAEEGRDPGDGLRD